MELSFNDTKVAFKHKTKRDLKRAHFLFKLLHYPWLVKVSKALTKFALFLRLPIKWLIRKTVYAHFVGGESVEGCAARIKELENHNVGTILDYSIEGQTTKAEFDKTMNEILKTVDQAHGRREIPFAVFKVSALGSKILSKANNLDAELNDQDRHDLKMVTSRVDKICSHAHKTGTPVLIDAEESWIQDSIDRLAESMMAKYNKERPIVFNTIQLYRHDKLQYMKESHERAKKAGYQCGFKLVRGAYMEKERERAREKKYPSPIQPNKEATDHDFNEAMKYCLDNLDTIAFMAGTHNEESCLMLAEMMEERGIERNNPRVWFAQLLGMSDHISFNLSFAGFMVAKYVPYGPIKAVMPYLFRRAEENTSVKGQTGRELTLITFEVKRRKGEREQVLESEKQF